MQIPGKFIYNNIIFIHLQFLEFYELFQDKKKNRFYFLSFIVLISIITGLLLEIVFFEIMAYYYIFLFVLYYFKCNYFFHNKFLLFFLSESSISIKFTVFTSMSLIDTSNLYFIILIKMIIIILINKFFMEKVTVKNTFINLFFCGISTFSCFLLKDSSNLSVFKMNDSQDDSIANRISSPFRKYILFPEEEEPNLQQMIRDNYDYNYDVSLPTDLTDWNIAKANNAYEDLVRDDKSLGGRCGIAKMGNTLLEKMKKEGTITDGISIHNKFTYNEIALLKFFGKDYILKDDPGLHGVLRKEPFDYIKPYSVSITRPIVPGQCYFGNYISYSVDCYRSNVRAEIKRINSKVWTLD